MLKFQATRREIEAISSIAKRAVKLAAGQGIDYKQMDAMMDIEATHSNGCPLRLFDLLAADNFNFAHDVFGILRHINRETGQLENCFVPRFAQPEQIAA